MLSYFNLRKGIQFIFQDQPFEVLEFRQMGKAQDVVVAQTKIKNLITGKTIIQNFHQSDMFEEADIQKFQAKFVYGHRGRYVFCDVDDSSKRFELVEDQIGQTAKFLKSNAIVEGLRFRDQIINISLPIKVQLKVTDAPPGIKGDRAQGGEKSATLETGAVINVPLFVETDDIIEINTETGEYVKRVTEK